LIYDLAIGRVLMRANAVQEPAAGMDPTHHEPASDKRE
jgi:hypothetical protein